MGCSTSTQKQFAPLEASLLSTLFAAAKTEGEAVMNYIDKLLKQKVSHADYTTLMNIKAVALQTIHQQAANSKQ